MGFGFPDGTGVPMQTELITGLAIADAIKIMAAGG